MGKDTKINEMAKVLNECCNRYNEQGNHLGNKCYECEEWSSDNHCCCSFNTKEATALYNAGYRKVSDVVWKIFDEIDEIAYRYLNDADYSCGDLVYDLNELKKKYTEDGE